MEIYFTKNIKNQNLEVTLKIADKKTGNCQTKGISILAYVDDEYIAPCTFLKEEGLVKFDCYKATILNGVKVGGFCLSVEDTTKVAAHLSQVDAQYKKDVDNRVKGLLNGTEKINVWNYSMSSLMTTLEHDKKNLDWQEVIKTAMKTWVSEQYPLVEPWQIEIDDLTEGLIVPNDAKNLEGCELSIETYKTMGGDVHPKFVLVPITSLLARIKKYDRLQKKEEAHQAEAKKHTRKADLAKANILDHQKSQVTKHAGGDGVTFSQDITTTHKNGKRYKFNIRNIFDFGRVINPEHGGLAKKIDEEWYWESEWWTENPVLTPIEYDELECYQAIPYLTDITDDIRL